MYRRVGSGAWVGIVVNARSGWGHGRRLVERLRVALNRSGFTTSIAWEAEERSALVARANAESHRWAALIAVGGDGTVMAMANERPRVPILVVPTGTENLFARQFGMRSRLPEVLRTIQEGSVLWIDLGQTGAGRDFTLMTGLGFDAEVVTRHHLLRTRNDRIRTTSRVHYLWPTLQACWSYPFPRLSARIERPDGTSECLEGRMIFVFNLPCYALQLKVAPQAHPCDGLLDVVAFRDRGVIHAVRALWLVFRQLHLQRDGIEHRPAHRVAVTCEGPQPAPIQTDGDPGGMLVPGQTWSAQVVPSALPVLVPPWSSSHGNPGRTDLISHRSPAKIFADRLEQPG